MHFVGCVPLRVCVELLDTHAWAYVHTRICARADTHVQCLIMPVMASNKNPIKIKKSAVAITGAISTQVCIAFPRASKKHKTAYLIKDTIFLTLLVLLHR